MSRVTREPTRRRHAAAVVVLGALSPACGPADRVALPRGFDTFFEEVATVSFEESPTDPIVGIAALEQRPVGGYILTDAASNRVHLFDGAGRLERTLGGSGSGPGELEDPTSAVELPDGHVYVTQRSGPRLTAFRPDDAPLILRVPGFYGSWISSLDGALVVQMGTREERFALLSLDGTVEATFGRLDPFVNERTYWIFFARQRAAIAAGRILMNTSFFPTIRVFDARGDSIRSFGTRPPSWIDPTAPPVDRLSQPGDLERVAAWVRTFTVVRHIASVADSLLLVQYGRHRPVEDDPYLVDPTTIDVYALDGRKLAEDVPFPERIIGGSGEILVLTAEPPAPWTVTVYRWRGLVP